MGEVTNWPFENLISCIYFPNF